MAAETRSTHDHLIARLSSEPYRFGFFQALRFIEAANPDAPGFGRSRRARQDPIRLGQKVTLAFASSTLAELQPATEARPERLLQYFHGVFGPNGPMPVHLTEYAIARRLSYHDPTLVRFCDIFHHRMLSLFYRIRANAEPAFCEDRPKQNRYRTYVGALAGYGTPALRNQDDLPDQAKLFYTGHYANQKRSPAALLGILSQHFSMPVELREFQPEWLQLPAESRLRLGRSRHTCRLGQNTVIGERTYERQFRFSLIFGPLSREQFDSLLPNRPAAATLAALVRNFVGFEFSWDYRLLVRENEVPVARLGRYAKLGWSSWLSGKPRDPTRPDFIHEPEFKHRPMEAVNG